MIDLARDTIFVTLGGSHAHGTARDGSDIDLRGVCIMPLASRVSLFGRFEQREGELPAALTAKLQPGLASHPTAGRHRATKTEAVIFDVSKFLGLCASANPSALEILFADEADWLLRTPAWELFYRHRRRFLTRKVQETYLGYAMAQLKRIRTHRAWLLAPPTAPPARSDYGLPDATTLSSQDRDRIEAAIAERIRTYGIDTLEMPGDLRIALQERLRSFWSDSLGVGDDATDDAVRHVAVSALSLPTDVARTLEAERRYRAALRQWDAYRTWAAQRNPDRADLERRHGYDTKHAMHLIRLMKTGLELLETGELRVRRPDADELNRIREGALTFDELLAQATRLRETLEQAARVTVLPVDVDRSFVDGLALELIEQKIRLS